MKAIVTSQKKNTKLSLKIDTSKIEKIKLKILPQTTLTETPYQPEATTNNDIPNVIP